MHCSLKIDIPLDPVAPDLEEQERRVIEAGSKEDATKALAKIHEQMSASRFCGGRWIEFLEGTIH